MADAQKTGAYLRWAPACAFWILEGSGGKQGGAVRGARASDTTGCGGCYVHGGGVAGGTVEATGQVGADSRATTANAGRGRRTEDGLALGRARAGT
jgi:hypothetical protein